jgi:hypothetical protein
LDLALGDQREHVALACGEALERPLAASAGEQLGDHLGVDDQAAVGHAPDAVDELRDVDNALLEQVAGAVRPPGDRRSA